MDRGIENLIEILIYFLIFGSVFGYQILKRLWAGKDEYTPLEEHLSDEELKEIHKHRDRKKQEQSPTPPSEPGAEDRRSRTDLADPRAETNLSMEEQTRTESGNFDVPEADVVDEAFTGEEVEQLQEQKESLEDDYSFEASGEGDEGKWEQKAEAGFDRQEQLSDIGEPIQAHDFETRRDIKKSDIFGDSGIGDGLGDVLSDVDLSEEEQQQLDEEEIQKRKNQKMQEMLRQRSSAEPSKGGSGLAGKNLFQNRNDIIRGILGSEIFDKPKGLRKTEPPPPE